jgi:hypothetical protein
MLQEAVTKQITVARLLGIGVPKRTPIVLQALGIGNVKNIVKNELELLDSVIHLGMAAMYAAPSIKIETALKAIELKNKLTGGAHAGLTGYGLDQLRELEQAKFSAVIEVVRKYIPDDKIEELEQAISAAEYAFYKEKAPELVAEYESTTQDQLDEYAEGEIIVSDDGRW